MPGAGRSTGGPNVPGAAGGASAESELEAESGKAVCLEEVTSDMSLGQ